MKTTAGKLRTTFLLMLALAAFPLLAHAADEPAKTAETKPVIESKSPDAKPAEPKPGEDSITGEAAASILSAYIWRGQELTRHSIVIQPSATISYKGFTLNAWGNLDTRPYNPGTDTHASNLTETDLTLSYTHKFGIVSVGAGYIYYGLHGAAPNGSDLLDSQEIFATVSVDTLLAPTLTVYKEIDHYHQWYLTLGISHTFQLHERVGLKLAGQISYLKSEDASTYPKFDSGSVATTDKFNNFHDAVVSVAVPVSVTKNITITPLLTYVFPLSEDARYEMRARSIKGSLMPNDKDSAFLYGGVTLSFAF